MRRTVAAALRAILTGVTLFFDTLIGGTIIIIAGRRNPASPTIHKVTRVWSRVFLWGARTKLTVAGGEDLDPRGKYVFVANHLSNLDIPVNFLLAPVSIRFLAKKELYRVPILRSALRAMGCVETHRQAGKLAHDDINRQIAETVSHGLALIIYPEGTRARAGELAPFKKGAFRIAIDNEMDVVPVSIDGTYEAWAPESWLVYGGHTKALVHKPISVAGLTLDDIDDLKDRSHKIIEEGIRELRRS